MDNLYNKYGYVIIKKNTKLFHNSNTKLDQIHNNSFFTLNKKGWNGLYTYTYNVIDDIKILLTISNADIINYNEFISIHEDNQILTLLYNKYFEADTYNTYMDICLKKTNTHFNNLCDKLLENNYNGFFNYIDSKTIFEIILFKPNKYLKLISVDEKIKNDINRNKQIYKLLLNKNKIEFNYPLTYKYKFNKTYKLYDYAYSVLSVFYYIYCQQNNINTIKQFKCCTADFTIPQPYQSSAEPEI